MSTGAYGVDLDALHNTTQGLTSLVDKMAEIGGFGESTTGDAVEELCDLDDPVVGDDALAAAVGDYGRRWQWGIRDLLTDAQDATGHLIDTRSLYQRAEDVAGNFMERIAFDLGGNPSETYHPGIMNEDGQGLHGMNMLGKDIPDPTRTTIAGHAVAAPSSNTAHGHNTGQAGS